ncbi:MAG: hypothetical protein JRG82_11605 [Deltaproteobacteria bacterium]|nr:hypothetical protein [Deltaproteobacteria bacterium]
MPDALPGVGEIVGPIVAKVEPEHQPLLIALAERIAARRYRAWAEQAARPEDRHRLIACADREEEVARRVEALFDDAAGIQAELLARHAGLEEIYRGLFEGRPAADQFTIQAKGERLGAATWRSFAERSSDDDTRKTYLECAALEEDSAVVLEDLVRAGA